MPDIIVRGTYEAGAIFSPCLTYRYNLWRRWDDDKPACGFIMLNPSTADENTLDPTLRRCVSFANQWGYGSLYVANIFALRSTDPKTLYASRDPVGPSNEAAIRAVAGLADLLVCAWGVHGALHGRGKEVREMLTAPRCLGTTKDGHPRHPLYLPRDAELIAY